MASLKKQKSSLCIFFYGFVMGICETIPGISAATFALLFGIYERLLNSVTSLLFCILNLFHLQKKIKPPFKYRKVAFGKSTFYFLLFLFLGMMVGVFLFSHIFSYLFENYTDLILSFFVGVIFSLLLGQGKLYFSKKFWKLNLIGSLLGFSLLFLRPYGFFGNSALEIVGMGFVAIFFGLLPGISGSFMLLLFGKYQFIIGAVSQLHFQTLFFFLVGVVLGGVVFLAAFRYLFRKYKEELLAFFFAFILGSCGILIRDIVLNYTQFAFILLCFLFGICFIFFQKLSS